jgi:hypothetical protein
MSKRATLQHGAHSPKGIIQPEKLCQAMSTYLYHLRS